jgi:hypothetical protein
VTISTQNSSYPLRQEHLAPAIRDFTVKRLSGLAGMVGPYPSDSGAVQVAHALVEVDHRRP